MTVLNQDWARRSAHTVPFRWLSTEPGELYPLRSAQDLADCFPTERFVRHDKGTRRTGKTYRNYSRELVRPGAPAPVGLPAAWRALLDSLTSRRYLEDVAGLLGQETAREVEIRLVEHAPGDWLGPHTDREDKLFSHVLYFNAGWQQEFGGCLEILEGDDANAVVGRIVPRLGASALLAQAPNSWHQVSKVVSDTADGRRSLLLHGLR
jgi:hypothetical protein